MSEQIQKQTILEEIQLEIAGVLDLSGQGKKMTDEKQLQISLEQVQIKMGRVLAIINQMEMSDE